MPWHTKRRRPSVHIYACTRISLTCLRAHAFPIQDCVHTHFRYEIACTRIYAQITNGPLSQSMLALKLLFWSLSFCRNLYLLSSKRENCSHLLDRMSVTGCGSESWSVMQIRATSRSRLPGWESSKFSEMSFTWPKMARQVKIRSPERVVWAP